MIIFAKVPTHRILFVEWVFIDISCGTWIIMEGGKQRARNFHNAWLTESRIFTQTPFLINFNHLVGIKSLFIYVQSAQIYFWWVLKKNKDGRGWMKWIIIPVQTACPPDGQCQSRDRMFDLLIFWHPRINLLSPLYSRFIPKVLCHGIDEFLHGNSPRLV